MSGKPFDLERMTSDRRGVLKAMGAAVASAFLADAAMAADQAAGSQASSAHAHHHAAGADPLRQRLIDAASECVKRGDACRAHCLAVFAQGDTSLVECARSVEEVVAACHAFAELAAFHSRHLKAMAGVCRQVCEDCKKQCDRHAEKHAACKACGDACAEFLAACEQFLA